MSIELGLDKPTNNTFTIESPHHSNMSSARISPDSRSVNSRSFSTRSNNTSNLSIVSLGAKKEYKIITGSSNGNKLKINLKQLQAQKQKENMSKKGEGLTIANRILMTESSVDIPKQDDSVPYLTIQGNQNEMQSDCSAKCAIF